MHTLNRAPLRIDGSLYLILDYHPHGIFHQSAIEDDERGETGVIGE